MTEKKTENKEIEIFRRVPCGRTMEEGRRGSRRSPLPRIPQERSIDRAIDRRLCDLEAFDTETKYVF